MMIAAEDIVTPDGTGAGRRREVVDTITQMRKARQRQKNCT